MGVRCHREVGEEEILVNVGKRRLAGKHSSRRRAQTTNPGASVWFFAWLVEQSWQCASGSRHIRQRLIIFAKLVITSHFGVCRPSRFGTFRVAGTVLANTLS
jgi:hypothetical protein